MSSEAELRAQLRAATKARRLAQAQVRMGGHPGSFERYNAALKREISLKEQLKRKR